MAPGRGSGGFGRWESGIRGSFRAMRDRGELGPDVSPGRLATATLAALQGGLPLAQVQRSTEPREVALDTVIDYVGSLTVPVLP